MLVNRCFPDEVIFNRHIADVRVLSGYAMCRKELFTISHFVFHEKKKVIWVEMTVWVG